MLSINGNFQHIDWSHDALPEENDVGDHLGTLQSYITIPSFTVGLTDYLNINFSQILGVRSMKWKNPNISDHHRDETSLTDYITSNGFRQAIGGLLGDSSIKLRYLYKNAGMKEGSRIYFGSGLSIPSNNILTESPFLEEAEGSPQDNEGWTGEHRHFSLSEGAYKALFELQVFKKRMSNPVFYGFACNVDIPINTSKYGFKPGISYSIVSSLVYNRTEKEKLKFLPAGITYGLSFVGTTLASWHGEETPNSASRLIIPSLGGVWNTSKGALSLSLQKPVFLTGLGADDNPFHNEAHAIEIVIGYRRNLGYKIHWL